MTTSGDVLQDAGISPDLKSPQTDIPADPPQPVKRKGGRKPVYTTVQERKQRNRMAQAAFRERRTEYIKQLEEALKENEDQLKHLQRNNRETTEECHMLRYKTSLLEDLLCENGIDYQSELQSRSSRSLLSSPHSTHQGNRQGTTSQMLPVVDQPRVQGGAPSATPQLRPIRRKVKSSSVHTINIHPSQALDMRSEPGSARSATVVSPFDSPELFSSPFDYPPSSIPPMQAALNGGRIDSVSTDSECESRTDSLDEAAAARSFRSDRRRTHSISYYDNTPSVRRPQNHRVLQNQEPILQRRPSALSPTMQTRFAFGKSDLMHPTPMELEAIEVLNQGPLPGNFEPDTE